MTENNTQPVRRNNWTPADEWESPILNEHADDPEFPKKHDTGEASSGVE